MSVVDVLSLAMRPAPICDSVSIDILLRHQMSGVQGRGGSLSKSDVLSGKGISIKPSFVENQMKSGVDYEFLIMHKVACLSPRDIDSGNLPEPNLAQALKRNVN